MDRNRASIRGFILFRVVYSPVSLRAKYPRDIVRRGIIECTRILSCHRWNLSCAYEFFFIIPSFFFPPRFSSPSRSSTSIYISYGLFAYLTNSRAFKFQMLSRASENFPRWIGSPSKKEAAVAAASRLDRKIFPQSNFYYALFLLVIMDIIRLSLNKPL